MVRRLAVISTAALLAVALAGPAPAQTDWRMTLGVLYALSYAVKACGIQAAPEELRRLERHISHAEGKVGISRAELADIRRKGEADARNNRQRMCSTMGRDAPRLLRELPDELSD